MTTQTRPSCFRRFSAFKAIILCLLAGLFSTAFAEDWDGSTSKPSSKEIDGVEYYVITSPSELAWFAYQVNTNGNTSINAVLNNDIYYVDDSTTAASRATPVIGNVSNKFNGIFDGNGHAIYGVNSSSLFDYCRPNFILKNLAIKSGKTTYGFVRLNHGKIENCVNYAVVQGASAIAHDNYGVIESCVNRATFTTDSSFGGITYVNWESGTVKNSQSFFDFCEKKQFVLYGNAKIGGIAAQNRGLISSSISEICFPKLKNSEYNSSDFRRIGGIAAENIGGAQSMNIENAVVEKSQSNVRIYSIESISSTSTVSAEFYFGGIAGKSGGTVKESQSVFYIDSIYIGNNLNNNFYIGGLVGFASCGLLGNKDYGFIEQSYSELSIDVINAQPSNKMTPFLIGGLVGKTQYEKIENNHSVLNTPFENSIANFVSASSYYWIKSAGLIRENTKSLVKNSYAVVNNRSTDLAKYLKISGIAYTNDSASTISNSYYNIDFIGEGANPIQIDSSSFTVNVFGKTTAVMQSPEFVETLNTNAGLDDDSGLWQYCEGNYPILVSEGTCEEFYSKYGMSSSSLSSSSSAESSSSTPVESSSSDAESSSSEIESSSSVPILSSSSEESSSSSVIASSSSDESSSSKAETSSSTKPESSSSSKANSSSSKGTDIAWNAMRPMFNLAVNGMTLTLSNTQGGVVRIFDALGHLVAAKPIASATTSITLQTPGNYIVRVNGISRSVTLK
ncbi:Por secretion system C-terminal sorting domain-containing protein [Fibrobacter sp. UWR3]|uniref:T9SS type A sorting domain-containing protein n=1 Tax=Fibrobacter sp. UWR3 TaxID=1896217 RepID=UPI00091B985C|nr:T9SS type A sorting domain-containing protein [Fibrobacter sp. UWR3]SHM65238.1 Por secretion system C-terminal sorting domain-containing protein [Fibrobacter sp. UWR3]